MQSDEASLKKDYQFNIQEKESSTDNGNLEEFEDYGVEFTNAIVEASLRP